MVGNSMHSAPSSSSSALKSLACSLARVIRIFRPNRGRRSNQLSSSRHLTTSPTTIIAGGCRLASLTFCTISESVPVTVCCIGVVPQRIRATGVSSRPAVLDEISADFRQVFDAHEKNERSRSSRYLVPCDFGFAALFVRSLMPGNEGDCRRKVPVGKRYARIGRNSGCSGNPRYGFERNTVLDQRLCLLAASSENERVSAFEPHDDIFASLFDQQGVYRLLAKGMIAAFLAYVDALSAGRGKFEQFLIGQVIENDHFGLLEDLLSPDRQKTGVSWSGPHEIDFAFFHRILFRDTNTAHAGSYPAGSDSRPVDLIEYFLAPRSSNSTATLFPSATASCMGAVRTARNNCLPSSEATRPESSTIFPAMRAWPPMGTWQPPSSSLSRLRSARTATAVSGWSRGARRRRIRVVFGPRLDCQRALSYGRNEFHRVHIHRDPVLPAHALETGRSQNYCVE